MIKIKIKGGDLLEAEPGITAGDLLAQVLSKKKRKKLLLARINGELRDLSFPLTGDSELEPVFSGDPEALEVLRHSASHLLAQAVKELYPQAKLAIGPAIESGFY